MREKTISPHRKKIFLRCSAWNFGLVSIAAQLIFGLDIVTPLKTINRPKNPPTHSNYWK
jgi:hypothetical protein